MKIHEVDIAKTDPDKHGGYDLLVDMNQVGLREDEESPPETIEVAGIKFARSVIVVGEGDEHLYWSYWNDDPSAVNLQLWFS